jgi:hypothetical protein
MKGIKNFFMPLYAFIIYLNNFLCLFIKMKESFNLGKSNQPLIDGEWYRLKKDKKPIVSRLTVNIRGNIAKFSLEEKY